MTNFGAGASKAEAGVREDTLSTALARITAYDAAAGGKFGGFELAAPPLVACSL